MYARILTLVRRSFTAAKLGFVFCGTARAQFPKTVNLVRRRIELSIPPQDRGSMFDLINVWLDDEYGLKSIACAPRTIIDIGANVGLFSLWAAHTFNHATIHAYEPNPRVLPYLRANVRGLPVVVFPKGLGSEQGRAHMIDDRESRQASTCASASGEVEIEPLAEAIRRVGGSVDLMKIDCEGAEWDLFKDRDSLRCVKEIRMEYHLINGSCLQEFKAKVGELGFSISRLSPNSGFGIAWLSRLGN